MRVTDGRRLLVCTCRACEGVYLHAWWWLSLAWDYRGDSRCGLSTLRSVTTCLSITLHILGNGEHPTKLVITLNTKLDHMFLRTEIAWLGWVDTDECLRLIT